MGSQGGAFSYERGTTVLDGQLDMRVEGLGRSQHAGPGRGPSLLQGRNAGSTQPQILNHNPDPCTMHFHTKLTSDPYTPHLGTLSRKVPLILAEDDRGDARTLEIQPRVG